MMGLYIGSVGKRGIIGFGGGIMCIWIMNYVYR